MNEPTLQQLIGEAKALAGDDVCAVLGHDWQSAGGRSCPRWAGESCGSGANTSQTVYVCARCPAEDYGDPGGPGYRDCYVRGPCDSSCIPPVCICPPGETLRICPACGNG